MFDLLSPIPTHEQTGADISIQDDAKGIFPNTNKKRRDSCKRFVNACLRQ